MPTSGKVRIACSCPCERSNRCVLVTVTSLKEHIARLQASNGTVPTLAEAQLQEDIRRLEATVASQRESLEDMQAALNEYRYVCSSCIGCMAYSSPVQTRFGGGAKPNFV